MIIPDNIIEPAISLKDQYFDLRGLSAYSALGVGTLRDHIKSGKLPAFKVKSKILIRRSEFDIWLEDYRVNRTKQINDIVDDVMSRLKGS
jgi:excisionase family DNA binding protein